MNYKETTEYLFSAMPSFQRVGGDAYKPGLERMLTFCGELNNPEHKYPVIHIAGTNGKGSTSHMLASVLQSAGYRVGLFTSPHLRDFRERIRINGEMISQQGVVEFVEQHREAMERIGLSFFEMTAAMAFSHFATSEVDVAVIETGLGGRLDATNVVDSQLSIITNIGLEHTQYLGTTLAEIAAEKGGIIKANRCVIIGERGAEIDGVFEAKAQEVNSELIYAENQYRAVENLHDAALQHITLVQCSDATLHAYSLDLMGNYQRHNIATLLTAVEFINSSATLPFEISEEALRRGLKSVIPSTSLIGRWQRLASSPLTICDTGHNLHGITEVTRQLRHQHYTKLYCVLGFSNDKDLKDILRLFPRDAHFIFTRPNIERAFDCATLMEAGDELGLKCEAVESVHKAMQRAQELATEDDMIFAGGSTFVVAELDL